MKSSLDFSSKKVKQRTNANPRLPLPEGGFEGESGPPAPPRGGGRADRGRPNRGAWHRSLPLAESGARGEGEGQSPARDLPRGSWGVGSGGGRVRGWRLGRAHYPPLELAR